MAQRLGRDAPAVQAGAAESIGFHHRDPPSGEVVSRQRVPAASTDNHKVVAVRRHRWPSLLGPPDAPACPLLAAGQEFEAIISSRWAQSVITPPIFRST